jgi:hypothetical protein
LKLVVSRFGNLSARAAEFDINPPRRASDRTPRNPAPIRDL